MTPFGSAVLPDVYMTIMASLGRTLASASSSSASSTRSRFASSSSTDPAQAGRSSPHIHTVRSAGWLSTRMAPAAWPARPGAIFSSRSP